MLTLLSRRGFLRIGALALGGLTLADVLRLRRAQAAEKRRDTAVILYWLAGGPSHLDTYDLKPDAPAEIRGPFRPIATRLPGFRVSEVMPHHAHIADRLAVLRSLRHEHGVHFDAAHWVQTGYPMLNAMERGQVYPCQGSVVSHLHGSNRDGVPAYVAVPDAYSVRRGFYQFAAYLGAQHNPVNMGGDKRQSAYHSDELSLPENLTVSRVADRRALLQQIETTAKRIEKTETFRSRDTSFQQAFELVTSPQARAALDLDREPVALRDKYGRHPWGRATLLARRLVEAGVTFVTVNHYEAEVDWWDDHTDVEKNLRRRLPMYDQALSALIEDIHDRGMDKEVLVIAMGEFGRSPRVNAKGGRDHWPRAMSAVLAGGGIRAGQIIGVTTADGGEPRERRLGPADVLATVYRVLGIDPEQALPDRQNRPVRLVEGGEPIRELFGT